MGEGDSRREYQGRLASKGEWRAAGFADIKRVCKV
jgi:hypothetical protein